MREFNTSGPCYPTEHYTVMRHALIAEGKEKVRKGRYFTIFAPRQSGKTTYFQLLLTELKTEGFIPIWLSFENFKTLARERFYYAINQDVKRELAKVGLMTTTSINDALSLRDFFAEINQPLVLVIDEFEGIPDAVLSEVMHTFRLIYHQKKNYALHALILVGVSTLSELVLSSASPFNIAEELPLPYFTFEEVQELILQYVTETGQLFEPAAIKAIYENTHGQPGLVCALCQHLVTKVVPDRSQVITMEAIYPTLQFFLTQRLTKNIINIVQKARDKKEFMLKLLFQPEPLPFSLYDPDISWLYAHGVVDNLAGQTDISVPLYKKVLITAFRPLINGEARYYLTSAHDDVTQYINLDGGLNLNALLTAYRAYVQRRGFRAFDTGNLRESACHYSLDGYLNFFIQQLGGQSYVEVPSGKGRIDILIRYQQQSYIIETKLFYHATYFKEGKGQLAAYVATEGLTEGYYVVFSDLHTAADQLYSEEIVAGKRIFTHIILTNFEQPSTLPVPAELRQRKRKKSPLK